MYPSSWLCQQVFGNVALVNTSTYNQTYDQPFLANSPSAPSNILFTYGSDDVWTTLGLSQQTNLNSNISILIINGAGHHFDLNYPVSSDTQDVINAREQFATLAAKWLGR